MALRDQPYLPLYVQDIMTDEKLNECSAATHGIYIKGIMCLMHKSDPYGKILLKQKYKQTDKQILNFASQLAKNLLYTENEISLALTELINEQVCFIEGDYLIQKRMVKDNEISEKRALAGKKGGDQTQKKPIKDKDFAKAKTEANPEDEDEDNIIRNTLNNKGVDFDFFWTMYDKKVGKKEAIKKKWDKLSVSNQNLILEHLPAYKLSQPDKSFRKHPETYLNKESWLDEIIMKSQINTNKVPAQKESRLDQAKKLYNG